MEHLYILSVILVILAFPISAAIYSSKKVNGAWSAAARQLKLQFTPAILGVKRRIRGRYRGMQVDVDAYIQRQGTRSTTYTRFTISYPESLDLELRLSSEGSLSGVRKVLGVQGIQVGDASFDDAVFVKGESPQRVIDFLTRARRVRISRFLTSHSGAVITDTQIQWKRKRVIRGKAQLVSRIKRIVELARCLVEERDEDATMEQALEAQHSARLDEAFTLLTGAPLISVGSPPDHTDLFEKEAPDETGVEEKVLEGELLFLAGRNEEAKEAFADAVAQDPEDDEARQWMTRVSFPSESAAPSPGPGLAPESADELEMRSVCADLFTEGASSFDVSSRFEKELEGKSVRGSGVLTGAVAYGFDFVFDDRDGTKATVNVGETDVGAYGRKEILAVLQLPEEAAAELAARVGETITFHGTLQKADGFMRNVFVSDAVVE